MKTFITSDIHFGHKNIMSFCPVSRARFKGDVDYMNAQIIQDWNNMIGPDDLVYILGDVAFCSWEKAVGFLRSMNGRKILIKGNHDSKLVKSPEFVACFESIHDYLTITYNGTRVSMFHYPIAEWDQMHRGAVHFYGHLHGGTSGLEKYRAIDVGMDGNMCYPHDMDVAVAMALKGDIKKHHDKYGN